MVPEENKDPKEQPSTNVEWPNEASPLVQSGGLATLGKVYWIAVAVAAVTLVQTITRIGIMGFNAFFLLIPAVPVFLFNYALEAAMSVVNIALVVAVSVTYMELKREGATYGWLVATVVLSVLHTLLSFLLVVTGVITMIVVKNLMYNDAPIRKFLRPKQSVFVLDLVFFILVSACCVTISIMLWRSYTALSTARRTVAHGEVDVI